ncbi:MAG: DUF1080 domain-containing protein [Sediminibacterium sp.]|jgi:Domain of Unknown Function (DUF1080)|uniref:3-keto-disaccharide hydrolase n=1 Tax=Sediminibacterium sp. TaxID=1917865 RepID=UPI002AB82233|nr:DUF1080 domain-containing protein [Sediminibacterium sp.]MDZ4070932.1 DUF1080 domain-containing protein [Sediminibacterium sp.]
MRICLIVAFINIIFLIGCTGSQNQLTSEEKKQGWILLFDGKTTKGWHGYNKESVPAVWLVKDGELQCDPTKRTELEVTDLVTDQSYENYELQFEWKISEGGNSGVFINVREKKELMAAWMTGPEYQLLEKAHVDFDKPEKKPGSLYAFTKEPATVTNKKPGEWNQSTIKQVNGVIEFYLNGVRTAKQDLTSQDWKDAVAQTHFKAYPEFGVATKGHIALQDWQKPVSFRNIKLLPL